MYKNNTYSGPGDIRIGVSIDPIAIFAQHTNHSRQIASIDGHSRQLFDGAGTDSHCRSNSARPGDTLGDVSENTSPIKGR